MSIRLIAVSTLLIIVIAAVLALAMGLSADRPVGLEQHGDVLLRIYPNDPDTLNPLTGNDSVSHAFQRLVYEGLAERDFADPDTWVPGLATDWEFDEQKMEYTIHLRRGVKWHPMQLPDGKLLPEAEFSARDIKFTFDCILNPHIEATTLRNYYVDEDAKDSSEPYKIKVSVVDKYTVKVRWTKPYFLAKEFTLGIVIIPRHVFSVDQSGEPIALNFSLKEFADGFNRHWANNKMCGTGPLMYKSWKRNLRLVLVKNPDYWGEPYHFDRLVYRCMPNRNTAIRKLLENDLDFVPVSDKNRFIELRDQPSVLDGRVKLVEYEYPGYRYIGYNLRRRLFKDVRVRRALAHATPVRTIIDKVFKSLAIPTAGPFAPGSSIYDDGIRPIPFDLDAARRLLDEAGWEKTGRDGVRYKIIDNVKVPARYDLMIYADAPAYRTIAEIIKEESRKIGVDVLVSSTKWALMLEKLNNREFDAAMLGWNTSWRSDPHQLWHGSHADEPYSSNHVGYRNPEVDKLIDQLRLTMDEDEQIPLFHAIQRLIYRDQPYTFLFVDKATGGYDSRLKSVDAEGKRTGGPLRFYKIRPCYDSREWYSDQPRTERGG